MGTRTPDKVVEHPQEQEVQEQQVCLQEDMFRTGQRVQEDMFRTGQRVEVSSNEEGFEGAWFVGVVVESSRKSKTKLLVQYETLLSDDGKKPLKEYITLPFIRPIPPLESLLPPSSSFQVGDVVDAYHRDAWWAGLIIQLLQDNLFLVSFQNPYEELTFPASSLRYHLQWQEGKWIRSQLQKKEGQKVGILDTMKVTQSRSKRQGKKPKVRKSGTTATGDAKSSSDKGGVYEGITNIDKDTMELQDKKLSEVHPLPQHQQLVDKGGVYEGITNIDKDTMELQDKKLSEVHPLPQHQQLVDTEIQTSKENDGDNGVDEKNKKRKRERSTLLLLKMFSSGQGTQKGEKSPSTSTPLVQNNEKRMGRVAAALTSPLSTLEQSTEVKRKRGRPPLKRTINLAEMTKASPKDSSNTTKGEASSKANHDKVNDDKKLSCEKICGVPTLTAEEGISSQTITYDIGVSPLCVVNPQDGGEKGYGYEIIIAKDDDEGHAKEEEERRKKEEERREKEEIHKKEKEIVEQMWPFDKCSPLWKTIESMQVFRKVPQKPHFSSLSKCEEQFREGLAIGCMVTFASTVDRISKLQLSDPTSVIYKYLETLAELENHGFDVETFRACLMELLAKKDREFQLQEESKKVVNEMVEHQVEKTRIEIEISENEAKIKEHQEKIRANTEKKDLMDEELAMLQSTKDQICEDIANVRLNFQKLVASL